MEYLVVVLFVVVLVSALIWPAPPNAALGQEAKPAPVTVPSDDE